MDAEGRAWMVLASYDGTEEALAALSYPWYADILVGIENGVDIWEPLPQTLFFNEGILLYGFNYTFADIVFFLDGTIFLEDLSSDLTQGIIFRTAILPADAALDLDLNNMESVMGSFKNQEVIRLNWSTIKYWISCCTLIKKVHKYDL